MPLIILQPTFEDWQIKARDALNQEWPPETVQWQTTSDAQAGMELFSVSEKQLLVAKRRLVPKAFLESARLIALHASHDKWALLYRVLWRLTHDEPHLLEIPADPDVMMLTHYEKVVTKDAYRMTAFVRFREISIEDQSWFVAWYEPEHDTLELNKDFFLNRFANMRWSILTPRSCMHWDGRELTFTPGVEKSAAPIGDDIEPLWIKYYSTVFNPARLKVKAMQAQLLKRNWKNLPEAAVIEPLIRDARRRKANMLNKGSSDAEPPVTSSKPTND